MRKTKMNIWGRDFKLDVIYDVYSGEEILDSQREAFQKFVENEDVVNNSLAAVKEYCLEDDNMADVDSIDNIFKYVVPTSIVISRTKKNREVLLICNYKWDAEHGLTLVFINEKLSRIE